MSTAVQVTAVAQAATNPAWPHLVETLVTAMIGALGATGAAWLGKRRPPKAAQAEMSDQIAGASEKMANSWDKMVTRLEQDNEKLNARLGDAEASLATVKQNLHDRNGWIMAARGWVDRMLDYVHQLEAQIRGLGAEPPPRPAIPDLPPPPALK